MTNSTRRAGPRFGFLVPALLAACAVAWPAAAGLPAQTPLRPIPNPGAPPQAAPVERAALPAPATTPVPADPPPTGTPDQPGQPGGPPVTLTPLGRPGGPQAAQPPQVILTNQFRDGVVFQPAMVQRFQFNIDPKSPVKDLLPVAPKNVRRGPVLPDDLSKVPEARFQQPLARDHGGDGGAKETAFTLAKINVLNGRETDAFMKALLDDRPDLSGLPFAMGDSCRTKGERSRQFTIAVNTVRQAQGQVFPVPTTGGSSGSFALPPGAGSTFVPLSPGGTGGPGAGPQPPQAPQPTQPVQTTGTAPVTALAVVELAEFAQAPASPTEAAAFWQRYREIIAQQDSARSSTDKALREHVTVARIAALMQVLAPESPSVRLGLVKYLSGVPHAEATRALAKLAVFSEEDEVRLAAIEALKVRRERDYTDVLLRGLRYPWPAVSKRAADAVAKLERTDLIPHLVDLLDDPDPRAPHAKEVDQKKVTVVDELVRVNHHRNCMMCHSPGNDGNVSQDTLTAPVPLPGEQLTPPSQGYRGSVPDLIVRIDVTYLRQDFSVMQAVPDAAPWPEMQRFDFLVRTREVSDEEAVAYREKLDKGERGQLSPYHRGALAALRELTGKDAEPTADAWRKLLDLPAKDKAKTARP
jgi:hypothetical protein